MKSTQLSLSLWTSLNRLSVLLSSLRLRQVKKRWVSLLQNLQKKIQHSRLTQMRKQVKQSSQVWVNFTLKLSLTDFFVSLRLRLTLVNLRFLTERLSEKQLISNINMLVNQVVKVSTVTYFLNLSRLKKVQVMNSLMQSSAVLFLRNISLLLTQVSKVLCSLVYLQVTT